MIYRSLFCGSNLTIKNGFFAKPVSFRIEIRLDLIPESGSLKNFVELFCSCGSK